MAQYVEVTVQVPEDRLAEFHILYGDWLQGTTSVGTEAPQPEAPKPVPWTSSDVELAKAFRDKVPGNPWKLVSMLSQAGELDETALISRLGLADSSAFNGVNGWVGRASFEFGRVTPTKLKQGENGTRIWFIEPEAADLFKGI